MQDHLEPLLAALLSSAYGLTGRLSRLPGESDNFLVQDGDQRYVLKVCTEAQTTAVLDLEHRAIEAVFEANLGLELPRIIPTGSGSVEAVLEDGDVHLRARLLRFVPGLAWTDAGVANEKRLRQIGRQMARIATVLTTVDHPAARRTHRWDLTRAEVHRQSVEWVDDRARQRLLEQAYSLFVASAEPFLDELPHSLIHGDLNDENVLVHGDRVTGILDFGDCLHNPMVCELAIALAYLLLDQPEPLRAGAQIVAGYHRERPLSAREIEVLFPLTCGRLAASVSIAAERRRLAPERSAWFVTEERAWRALECYMEIDPIVAAELLASAADLPVNSDRAEPHESLI